MHHDEPRKRASIESPVPLLVRETAIAPQSRRPGTTALGAGLTFARALVGVAWLGAYALVWREMGAEFDLDVEESRILLWLILGFGGLGVLVLGVLAVLIWRGSNFARVVTMAGLTASIITAAVDYFRAGQEITINTSLLTVAIDILVLLALSSREARAWARGSRTRRRLRREAKRDARNGPQPTASES
ncbi:hypothetical protein AB3K78_14255 [Leucobacter sp. HNU]|uniref:hypothetical protein n=1 Tax=Leucobacter sp. HNU TaxID=3236805 RepID=UPI003A8072F7